MQRFFDAHDASSFISFSPSHVITLILSAIIIVVFYMNRQWFRIGTRSRNGRYILAAVLALAEISLNIWYIGQGTYSLKNTLPLELCSISLYLSIIMLLWKSRTLFQIVYFIGLGGALQALLTPALGYAYPHFRFVEFFIAHIVIILAVLYMVWVEGYRPKLQSILSTMLLLNVLLIAIGAINWMTGGNYMFLAHKPESASILNFLGPHPWYLLSLEAVALGFFLLLYLPFAMFPRVRRVESKLFT